MSAPPVYFNNFVTKRYQALTFRYFTVTNIFGHTIHFVKAEWARVKEGWESFNFLIKESINEGAVTMGGGNILIRKLPLAGKNFMYCPRGPVLDFTDKETLLFFTEKMKSIQPRFVSRLDIDREPNEIMGAISIFFGDKCWYLYGASSNSHRNVMPNYLLQWEMIREPREAGKRIG